MAPRGALRQSRPGRLRARCSTGGPVGLIGDARLIEIDRY